VNEFNPARGCKIGAAVKDGAVNAIKLGQVPGSVGFLSQSLDRDSGIPRDGSSSFIDWESAHNS